MSVVIEQRHSLEVEETSQSLPIMSGGPATTLNYVTSFFQAQGMAVDNLPRRIREWEKNRFGLTKIIFDPFHHRKL